MNKALVIAQIDQQTLNPVTLSVITAAKKLTAQISVVVFGENTRAIAQEVARVVGINDVLVADDPVYQGQLAENSAELIAEIAADFAYILAPASTFGKNLLPRVAALLDTSQLSDVIEIISEDTFKRPIYAGNAFATVKMHTQKKCLTIRTTHFAKANFSNQVADIKPLTISIANQHSQLLKQELNIAKDRPELTQAKVVIAGGRGLQSAEQFKKLEKIAGLLNAAIGASRAAVDAGFVANDFQVGQTGKIVAPDLYIAIGISGAIQHLAGMKDSKVIVAINKDPDAPIFQAADYGLVADFFKILPELEQELSTLKQ